MRWVGVSDQCSQHLLVADKSDSVLPLPARSCISPAGERHAQVHSWPLRCHLKSPLSTVLVRFPGPSPSGANGLLGWLPEGRKPIKSKTIDLWQRCQSSAKSCMRKAPRNPGDTGPQCSSSLGCPSVGFQGGLVTWTPRKSID